MNKKEKLQVKRLKRGMLRRLRKYFLADAKWRKKIGGDAFRPGFRRVNHMKAEKLDSRRGRKVDPVSGGFSDNKVKG